ncbi:hypothetical protein RHSIM_Rhsim09G0132800 [Rhododendron simsii]|uniref:Glycolipid transfer protein domain-containing protein n=1 Tax=Rhododendron simsii TaxID=118357 RepID=A0A834LEW1_RHOSS|nr:hypothetical protein RHSIM_Rhsim09G0132800 [Rhododendron simsii]
MIDRIIDMTDPSQSTIRGPAYNTAHRGRPTGREEQSGRCIPSFTEALTSSSRVQSRRRGRGEGVRQTHANHAEFSTVLTKIAEAFNELADDVNSPSTPPRLSLSKFCSACRLLSPLIGCMGIACRFADLEFSEKVGRFRVGRGQMRSGKGSGGCRMVSSADKDCNGCRVLIQVLVDELTKASESIDTIEALIDLDIAHNAGKNSWSNSRNIIRANRTVDFLRIMFEQILAQRGNFIAGPGLTAYEQVFAPYHSLAMKTAVRAVALTLPTTARLLRKLKETEASAIVQMQKFVIASATVIQYINNLFHLTENGDDF